ncbi:hypothetical protein [Ulvibacterium sp.]|uniref:hypothetical protein n=1 Tax=Ulvibacterium sp. TaxID=2665914 RepID=UPI00262B4F05|nr:hypothetical protein [Ulvibacterium sp.]
MANTGYTSASAIFDLTAIENPFYETTSRRDSFIEEMKNGQVIVHNRLLEPKKFEDSI